MNPMLILDLKGDEAMFSCVRDEARRSKREFLFFTPEKGKASHRFNPFLSMESKNRSPIQLCQLILDALSLNHGEGYGKSYFSSQSRTLLLDAINHPSRPRSFPELHKTLLKLCEEGDYQEGFELLATIQTLTQYPQLVVTPEYEVKLPHQIIHMPQVLERNQIVYFWLPSAVESVSTREIGKLGLFSLLSAAIDRDRARMSRRQTYVFIDEFQRIAGENFNVLLEQARSFGLALILANQSQSALNTPAGDLRPAVRSNTRVKMYFSVSDQEDVKLLSETSGEEVQLLRNHSNSVSSSNNGSSSSSTVGFSETMKPRLTTADIRRISDHPRDFVLHISRGSGYSQFYGLPFPVRTEWPMSKERYMRYKESLWPEVEEFEELQPSGPSVAPGEAVNEIAEAAMVVNTEGPKEMESRGRNRAAEERRSMMEALQEKYTPEPPLTEIELPAEPEPAREMNEELPKPAEEILPEKQPATVEEEPKETLSSGSRSRLAMLEELQMKYQPGGEGASEEPPR